MDIKEFINLVKSKNQTIISIILIVFLISAVITFVQPLKYNSRASVLVVQNFSRIIDQSTLSKSNEHISNILAKVVSSNLFYNDVLNSGYEIDKNYFSQKSNINAEMDKWKKTAQAKAIGDTGIIDINIYHPDKQQLNQIALAVNFVLKSKHWQYHGLGSSIMIKIINKPIISAWPAKPNIILNLALAFVIGAIISLYYIYLFPGAEYNIRIWPEFGWKKLKEERIFSGGFFKKKVLSKYPQFKENKGFSRPDAGYLTINIKPESYNPLADYSPAPKPEQAKPAANNQEKKDESGKEIENLENDNGENFILRGSMNNLR